METGKGKLDSTKIVSFATQGILKIVEYDDEAPAASIKGVVVVVIASCIGSFSQIKFALKQKEMKNEPVQKLRNFTTFHCNFDRSNERKESHQD